MTKNLRLPLKARWLVLAGFGLLSLVTVIVVASQPRLKLAPETVRPYFKPFDEESLWRISRARPPSKVGVSWSLYGEITGDWTKERPSFDAAPPLHLVADENQTITFSSGETFSLKTIQMSYPTGPGPDDRRVQSFDAATFAPKETVLQERHKDWFLEGTVYPKMAIQYSKGPNRLESRLVFENGVPLRQNSSRGKPDLYGGSHEYWRVPWYSMPAVLTTEFTYGEDETAVLPIHENAVYRADQFEIVILASGHFDQAGQGELKVTPEGRAFGLDAGFAPVENLETGFTVVILRCRRIDDMPGRFRWKSASAPADTRPKMALFTSMDDDVVFTLLPDDQGGPVQKLEFTFQKRALGIFRLSKIPGLPEENYGLTNLFATKVPFVQFDGVEPYEYGWFLPNHLGLEFEWPYSDREFPKMEYPITYLDKTYDEILTDFRQRHNIYSYELNDDVRLVGELGPWKRFRSWYQQKMRELRR